MLLRYNSGMSEQMVLVRDNSLFTREAIVRFYEATRYGSKVRAACQYAGISYSTYYLWKRRAAKGEEPFATFMLGVEQARGEFIVRNLQAIAAHTAIDWKAAAWLLERSEPETYAMRQYIEEEPALLKELKELVGAGLVSVREVKEQMPDLPTEYLNALMALETSIIDEQEVIPEQVIAGEAIEESKLPEALQQLK